MHRLFEFDGSVGRNRRQEAVMNSLNDRDAFWENVNRQRLERAKDTKERSAALRIQKTFRKYAVRKANLIRLRVHFDEAVNGADNDAQKLVSRARQLNLFYSHKTTEDNERLTKLCSQLMAFARSSSDKSFLPDVTRRILSLKVLAFLRHSEKDTLFTMPVRFLEVFCTPEDLVYLSQKGWFQSTLSLIAVSAPDSDVVEPQERLPGRLQTLCELLMAPFKTTQNKQNLLVRLFSDLCRSTRPNPMYSIALPFILRCRDSLFTTDDVVDAVGAVELDEKNRGGLLLRCHVFLQLLCYSYHASGDAPANLISGFTFYAAPCFKASDRAPATAKLENILHEFLKSPVLLKLFSSAASSPSFDLKAIVALNKLMNNPSIVQILAESPTFMDRLYSYVMSMKGNSIGFGKSITETFATKLKHGYSISDDQQAEFLPALSLLCTLVCKTMETFSDEDISLGSNSDNFRTIVSATRDLRNITLGLIDLAFPENFWSFKIPEEQRKREAAVWSAAYDELVKTLQTVQRKNGRVKFLPDGFWTDHMRQVVVNRTTWVPVRPRRGRRGHQEPQMAAPFSFVRLLHQAHAQDDMDSSSSDSDMEVDNNEILPNTDLRNLSIVKSIPFVLPFEQRLKIFNELLTHDKEENGVANDPYGMRSQGIQVSVRRQHLYDDAFEAFSPGNVPNMKLPTRVHMVNWAGINEPGVDGGGIFREFLSEVLKTGLDPGRGLFCYTHDGLLYPNPSSAAIFPHEFSQHFYFLGRMVAKLIYEGMMLDVRFADFFLGQLLGTRATNIDLDQMKSYDPSIYKHLRALLSCSEEQLAELGLEFSVIIDELGTAKTVELKPGGKDILVNRENLREYIQLRVNFFLYKRIMPMVDAMRAGVSDVIEPGWLGMFDPSEIQKIVSGVDADIDVNDMKRHCEVYNVNQESDAAYMDSFWDMVRQFSLEDKAALLKFITGCPRPPINGFTNLAPNLGIQLIHDDSILPMSATCMNMFKLPKYKTVEEMKKKIRYAIHSGAGFELA